jgi:hypothetical protein
MHRLRARRIHITLNLCLHGHRDCSRWNVKDAMPESNERASHGTNGENRELRYVRELPLHAMIARAIKTEILRLESYDFDTPSTMRSDLRELCVEAKRAGLRAEQLIIVIKEVWIGIPEARGYARPADLQSLLSHVVTLALDEYYRPDPTPA